jgi:phospholipid-binding lipoprotein MlaA
MAGRTSAILLLISVITLAGCATQKPVTRTPGDPFERMNRRMYAFNEAFDKALAKPIAKGYRRVTPQFFKTGLSNFLSNLSYPAVIMNDALQGKAFMTARDTGRFVMNTTVGLAGFFDPATRVGLEARSEDLGQTLGRWGVPQGPYIVLPFSNPTTLRDGFAKVADPFTSPLALSTEGASRYAFAGLRALNTRSKVLSVESALDSAYDPYAVIRSIYWQRRNYAVHDGNVPEDPWDEEMRLEDEQEAALASVPPDPQGFEDPDVMENPVGISVPIRLVAEDTDRIE